MATSHTRLRAHEGVEVNRSVLGKTNIDRILECAVALNWNGLTQADQTTAMQVECRNGPSNSLEYLKLWSSTTRGFWNLVCEYWMQSNSGHTMGVTFCGREYSGDFTWMLDAIMQHQRAFRAGSSDFVEGLVQIKRPTLTDLASAQADMTEALDRIGSHLR
jgi:hypothetical protein